jgi:hypothetical protein
VFEIWTSKYADIHGNKKVRRIDLHSLKIAGRKATAFNSQELYTEMNKLGVPDINICFGWSQLAEMLGVFQQRQEEAEEAKQ